MKWSCHFIITTSPMVAPLSTFAVLSIMKQSICLHDYCYVLMVLVSSFHSRKMQYQAFFQPGRVLFLSALFLKVLSALVSWSTLVDLFNWFCLSAFIPAYLSVRFGVWLYQPIWFVILHQCCGADRIRTPRGPMCFFPLDIALVPVSSHGASDILPCETVRVTFTWC